MTTTYIEEFYVKDPSNPKSGNHYSIEIVDTANDSLRKVLERAPFHPTGVKFVYRIWHDGCGIGDADTIAKAREKIFEYVRGDLLCDLSKHQLAVVTATELLAELGIKLAKGDKETSSGDPFYLSRFLKD